PSDDLRVFRCDGQPADCVKVALHALTEGKPDLVVSGINNGWNVGTDVHYSGTVGAAFEAAFECIQALAVSIRNPDADRYANAAALAVRIARQMLLHPLPERVIANLNLPDCPAEAVRGLIEAPLTPIRYTDHYECLPNTSGRAAYWLSGDIIEEGRLPGGDLDGLLAGYATLTALSWDLTLPGLLNAHIQGE
ncbi:MAG: hypothetical protein LBN04_10530, partial [Oscillospiraceae bacterium]|nr:hypothetical protein [Oscillospiraceae bacterium]